MAIGYGFCVENFLRNTTANFEIETRDQLEYYEISFAQQAIGIKEYSDESLIRAPIVRKSRLSGQKVQEPISFSGLMGVSVIRKTRLSGNIGREQTCPD